ncbi:PilZ domain-containing protein [bacterium]|nr:MAG: PilZ domain-containing protein [bacterium]
MQEKRWNVRWQVNREGNINLLNEPSDIACSIRDISIAGARIYSSQRLPDNNLSMGLRIANEVSLDNVKASVIWRKEENGGSVYGLAFNNLGEINKDKVYDFVYKSISQDKKEPLWRSI